SQYVSAFSPAGCCRTGRRRTRMGPPPPYARRPRPFAEAAALRFRIEHRPLPGGYVLIEVVPPRGRHGHVLVGWELLAIVGVHGPADPLACGHLEVVIDIPRDPHLEDVALRVVRVHNGNVVLDLAQVDRRVAVV